jgi:DNA-binding transcriptional ArsR family regulator
MAPEWSFLGDMDTLLQGMRAVAEPTRLRLLALCAHAELTVTELTQILGQSQPRVSRHLKLLVEAGLLDRFREGTWAFYRLAESQACATLGRTVVDLIPENDPTLTLDLERLEAVKSTRAAQAADYFRSNAARWDQMRSLYVDEAEIERAMLALLNPRDVGDLLDIGTGTGRMLVVYGEAAGRAVGIDHQVLHYADAPADVIAEAARALRPGGRLIVADFAPHREETLREEHAHRRLGFSGEELANWLHRAKLIPEDTTYLHGDPLTIGLWAARRPANDETLPDWQASA